MIMLPALRSWVPWVVALPVCVSGVSVGWASGSAAQTLSVRHPEPPAMPAPAPAEPAAVRLDPDADSAPPPAAPAPVPTPSADLPQPAPEPPAPAASPSPEQKPTSAAPASSPPPAAGSSTATDKSATSTPSPAAPPPPASPPPAQLSPAQVKPAQPQAAQVKPAAPAEAKPARPADSLKLQKFKVAALIDRVVIGKEKAQIGHVIDVLVDEKGEPAALVVDVGGFLGVGNRRIAIAWERFALAGRNFRDPLQLPLSDAQVKSAPAYDGSEEVTVIQGAIEPPGAKPSTVQPPDAAKPAAPPGGSDQGVPSAAAKQAAPSVEAPPAAPSGVEDPAVSRVDVGHQVEVSAGSGRPPEPAPTTAPLLHPAPGSFMPTPAAHTPSAPPPPQPPARPALQQPH
ncbi:PRC-barrel domain-containing protein [Lichenicoccus sp.]|uniref:PRC-barrel domain-containing protein n=1 Tax=Lichenicoccus sp. TaxID=2781899 RepID=UPI003D1194A3